MFRLLEILLLVSIILLVVLLAITVLYAIEGYVIDKLNKTSKDAWFEPGGHLYEK